MALLVLTLTKILISWLGASKKINDIFRAGVVWHLHEYSDKTSLIIDKNRTGNKTTSFSALNGGGPIKFEVILVGEIIIFVIRVRRFLVHFFNPGNYRHIQRPVFPYDVGNSFLDATMHLYKKLCPSVRRSVRPSRVIFEWRIWPFLSVKSHQMTS